MRRLLILIGLLAVVGIAAIGWIVVSDRTPRPRALDRAAFDARVIALSRRDAPSSSGLWHDPDYLALSGMGETSVAYAIDYLRCGCRSAAQQAAVVAAMYPLPLRQYAHFLRQLSMLYDKHAVGTDALTRAVGVPSGFSTALQRGYRDPEARAALKDIASRSGLPASLTAGIAGLLSGATWARTRAFCLDLVFEDEADCRTVHLWDFL